MFIAVLFILAQVWVLGSSPSGSRNTPGMSGVSEEEDRYTQKVV